MSIKLSYAMPLLDNYSFAEMEAYIRAVSEAGFQAIEPSLGDAGCVDPYEFKKLLEKYGMELSGFRSGGIAAVTGSRLSSPDPEVRALAVRMIKKQVDLLKIVGGNLLVGGMQGSLLPGEDKKQAEMWILDAMREIGAYAAERGVMVAFEPITRFEINYHNTTREMMGFIDHINETLDTKITMLFDVFHSTMDDPSLPAAMVLARDMLGHIHLSDTDRCEPGSGSIRFDEVFRILDALDYEGFVTVEIWPRIDLLEAAKVSMDYLRPILDGIERRKALDTYKR